MLNQHIISKGEHLKWIETLKDRKDWKFWVIFYNSTPIGSIYFQNIDYDNLSSEWGFYIGEEEFKGKGLSKYILFKLLEIFFEEMKFKTLITKVLSTNGPALSVYDKFKFRKLKSFIYNNKEFLILEFTSEEWKKWKSIIKSHIY